MSYLTSLNPEQHAAVIHSGSPLLILAGAGSGKTRVITTKIAYLIQQTGLAPQSILAVTFTNKAAREMKDRATRLEPRAADSVIRTFHSFGAWLLRRNAGLIGLDPNFTIYDDDDAKSLLAKAVPSLNREQLSLAIHKISRAKDYCLSPDSPDLAEIDPSPEFAQVYSSYERRLRETGNLDFGDLILLPIRLLIQNPEVQQRLQSRFQVVMVDEYQDSNRAQYEFLKAITGKNTYLCVVGDDDQSIYKFRGAEVQNILSFSESFPGTQIIRLERNYRSVSQVLQVAGEIVSYNEGRLGKTLVAERGKGKKPQLIYLPNQDAETAFCASLIKEAHKKGQPWSNWAILYRTNAQSLGFETEFLHQKIPYKVVGSLKFYEREEIKDALAFLALIVNGRDEIAFRRVVNKPARGIGAKSQDLIIEEARVQLYKNGESNKKKGNEAQNRDQISVGGSDLGRRIRSRQEDQISVGGSDLDRGIRSRQEDQISVGGSDLDRGIRSRQGDQISIGGSDLGFGEFVFDETRDLISAAKKVSASLSKKARTGLNEFLNMLDSLKTSIGNATSSVSSTTEQRPQLSAFVESMLDITGILGYHQNQDEVTGTQRAANLQELVNSASLYEYSIEGLTNFLEHIELDRALAQEDENDDSVTLITIHNTKGLEFPKVIITGLESGIFPRDDKKGEDLEEERRLMYVGCTRAMDELYLTSCKVRRLYGRTSFMEPSPFLYEIKPDSIKIYGEEDRVKSRSFGDQISARGSDLSTGIRSRYGDQTSPRGSDLSTGIRSRHGDQTSPQRSDPSTGIRSLHGDQISPQRSDLNNRIRSGNFDAFPKWKKGATVFHDDYGYGIISKAFDSGDQFVVLVQFETGGEKRFLPAYQGHSIFVVED